MLRARRQISSRISRGPNCFRVPLRRERAETRAFRKERVMQLMTGAKRETEPQAGRSERMRILVIEDDREAATWLIKGLTESGHVADLAADGEEGLALAREKVHDVLI